MEEKEKSKKVVENIPEVFSFERIEISEVIIHELVKVLNHIHETDYSYRFWKIIVGEYVNSLVSIKPILEQQEMKTTPPLQPVNSHDVPTLKQKVLARAPAIIKHYKTLRNQANIFKLLETENYISIGLPDIEAVQKDTGPAMPIYYPVFPGSGNTQKRKKANILGATYKNIFYRNMVMQLPMVYVEYFGRLFDKIPLHKPAQKIFHSHGLPPFYNSLVIAKYINAGAKLYCYQHGAYYGEMKGHNSHFNESSVADEFRTWGWKIRGNDAPWKAYRLEKFKIGYEKEAKTGEYDFLMCYPDVFHANRGYYKKITDYFLQTIDGGKYKKIMARPRPMNKMFSHANRLSFIDDSRVTVDSGLGSMAVAIAKSRIVIQFSVPATNFMECLYVNHPTIGLLDNNQPTDAVKPYYDFLMQHGVLHNNFASLVGHLNKINVDEWWAAIMKEPMYLQFKNEFLRKV